MQFRGVYINASFEALGAALMKLYVSLGVTGK
jgi:hypothetical protein